MQISDVEVASLLVGRFLPQVHSSDSSISADSTQNIKDSRWGSVIPSRYSSTKRVRDCDNDDENENKLPMKKQYYQKVPFHRILKRDVRRTYAQMYLNVMNSGDISLTVAYFQRFYDQNCTMSRLMQVNENGQIRKTDMSQTYGRDLIALHFASLVESIPDLVCQWRDASIRQHLNSSGSEVILEASFKGTRFYNLNTDELKAAVEKYQQQTARKEHVMMQILQDSSMYLKMVDPMHFTSIGQVTMFLDENNCIQSLEITRLLVSAEQTAVSNH